MSHGILLINKEKNITSFQAVKRIKRILKIKKIGHSGTLDPLATGLLCIGIGQGTKTFPYISSFTKTYIAEGKLGLYSDTYDITGEISEGKEKKITLEEIQSVLTNFQGKIEQNPPIFSALKIKGKPAYHYARNGIAINLETRIIHIHSIKLLKFEYPNFIIEIVCSGGTYVRSLIHDMGLLLGTGAVMTNLHRTRIGFFDINDAISIEHNTDQNLLWSKIISIDKSLNSIPLIKLAKEEDFPLENGLKPVTSDFILDNSFNSNIYRVMKKKDNETILAIVKREKNSYNGEWIWSYARVFKY